MVVVGGGGDRISQNFNKNETTTFTKKIQVFNNIQFLSTRTLEAATAPRAPLKPPCPSASKVSLNWI